MFGRVQEIEVSLAAAASDFDPSTLDAASVVPMYDLFDRIERLATACKLRLARRVDEVERWKVAGYASAAEYLAAKSGSSVASAKDALAVSARLTELPVVDDALRSGALSGSQAVAVADAAAMAPREQSRLVNDAQRTSLAELRQECLRTKAAVDPDREATRDRIHQERYVRTFTDPEGAWNLQARGSADAGARIEARLRPIIDEEFHRARAQRQCEERDAYAFDALMRLTEQSATHKRAPYGT